MHKSIRRLGTLFIVGAEGWPARKRQPHVPPKAEIEHSNYLPNSQLFQVWP